ncbi:MAG: hypothetical protein LBP21_00685 [Synergistaceae bacterium]|nr:hypothetical protein [Synergistaceae bacterium]
MNVDLEGGVEQPLFEATLTPSVNVCKGVAVIPVAGPVVVPIPWGIGVSLVAEAKVGFNAGLDLNYNTVWAADAGFYWDGDFHMIKKDLETVGGSGLRADPSVKSSAEIGFGPKILLDVCAAPFISLKSTVGAKFEMDWGDVDAWKVDGKFKLSLTADLLEMCKKWSNLFDELKFSVNIIDYSWPIWPKNASPNPPPTNGNWIDVADTSWYSPYKTEFEISSAEQLAGLAKIVNDTGALRDDFSGKTIHLTASINLAGREWTPIGYSYYSSFQGTFDGGGGTIANMTVNAEGLGSQYSGLFGENRRGTIKNVNLSNIDVSSSSSSFSAAGGIAGGNSGTIGNCTASGREISAVNTGEGEAYRGGLIGYNRTYTYTTVSGNNNETGISPAIGLDYRKNPPAPSDEI